MIALSKEGDRCVYAHGDRGSIVCEYIDKSSKVKSSKVKSRRRVNNGGHIIGMPRYAEENPIENNVMT